MQQFIAFFEQHWLLLVAFIIVARIADVSLGTVRTICVVKGLRKIAGVLGFFEVLVWVIAVSGVLVDITWLKVFAYATGFAIGNAVGIVIEQRIGMGMQMIFFMSKNIGHSVAAALRFADFRVTEIEAAGQQGKIAMSFVIVSRRKVRKALDIAYAADPDVRTVVTDVRDTALERVLTMGNEPTGWRAILKKK